MKKKTSFSVSLKELMGKLVMVNRDEDTYKSA
jgi:hypothetical protein